MEFESGKKDYSSEFEDLKPKALEAAGSNLQEALLLLLSLEKKCRNDNDNTTLKEVCVWMLQLCREKQDWEQLNSTLTVINKRRNQSTMVLQAVVTEGMGYIDGTPNQATKIELIKTLKDVCKGKMYVEAEDARLHLMLAHIHEKDGDVGAACDMIQDVHVETYGSLTKMEKCEYILEQIRLNLIRGDFVRTLIQSRKMNLKVLEEEGFEKIKVTFNTMMVDYNMHKRDPWEICQAYYKIFSALCKDAQADDAKKTDALQSCIVFLLLSKFDNHQSDMMHRLVRLKELESAVYSAFKQALLLFTTPEIIPYPFPQQDTFDSHVCVGRGQCGGQEAVAHFKQVMRSRVVQHNIRTVSKYYTRVRTARVADMLGLSGDELEKELSEMYNSGDVVLKIDRPTGIVTFERSRRAEEVLSDWTSDITKMLGLVESTCHLINRERMVHQV